MTKTRSGNRTRDPIFVAIATHKRLGKKHDAANAAEDRLIHRLGKTEPKHCINPSMRITSTEPKFLLNNGWFLGDADDVAKHVRNEIRNASHHFGPRTAKKIRALAKSAEHELNQMVQANAQAHERRRRKAGLTMAAFRREVAKAEELGALKRLLATKPTTPAGAAALIAYVRKLGLMETTFYQLNDDLVLNALLEAAAMSKAA